jgi:hypothetical protein
MSVSSRLLVSLSLPPLFTVLLEVVLLMVWPLVLWSFLTPTALTPTALTLMMIRMMLPYPLVRRQCLDVADQAWQRAPRTNRNEGSQIE